MTPIENGGPTNTDVAVAIAKLETKVDAMQGAINELKVNLQTKTPVLPVTGGLVGLAAAVWTGYLQATGRA